MLFVGIGLGCGGKVKGSAVLEWRKLWMGEVHFLLLGIEFSFPNDASYRLSFPKTCRNLVMPIGLFPIVDSYRPVHIGSHSIYSRELI